MKNMNIMIVGVGGQGTLLTSRIFGAVAVMAGFDVKISEVHGMAQRGGSVVTYVKMGDKVYSPVIEKGQADLIIAFELLEAMRWLEYLKPGGELLVNNQRIDPMPVIIGKAKYPDEIIDKIRDKKIDVKVINALEIAKKCGNIKAVNTVMVGFSAKSFDIDDEIWLNAIKETVKPQFIELNIKAYQEGKR